MGFAVAMLGSIGLVHETLKDFEDALEGQERAYEHFSRRNTHFNSLFYVSKKFFVIVCY